MIRTDLAMEAHSMCRENSQEATELPGVKSEVRNLDEGITLTIVQVLDQQGERLIGKPAGCYVTIEVPDLKYNMAAYEAACYVLRDELKKMIGETSDKTTLVTGLGNRDITPDALGADVVSGLMVTNHLKTHMPQALHEGISSVCAVAPGVLGTTGMESAEIIKGVAQRLKPDIIIAVDALAAADCGRIGNTIQLCDTGIQPGAGVGNNRTAINEKEMGAKVIAIGVPTVVDASALMRRDGQEEPDPFMVTPKDIDLVIERAAKVIANGINLALHEDITIKEAEEFVG